MTHLATQPGLHAHSVNPDRNIMKRFLVSARKPLGTNQVWSWVNSFATLDEAQIAANATDIYNFPVKIEDQWDKNGNLIVETFEPGNA